MTPSLSQLAVKAAEQRFKLAGATAQPTPRSSPGIAQRRGLATFDCFDTAVTRVIGAPASVGYVVAERLRRLALVDLPGAQFVALREHAEDLAFRRHDQRHTLRHVCGELADLLGLPDDAAAQLEKAELDVERELSRAVPGFADQLARLRATGAQIGFLSDTPLPRAAVADLLTRHHLLGPHDLLWVSNELNAEKNRGTAFFEVARLLGRDLRDWRHAGDNLRADVGMARLSGITAEHLPHGELNRYERALEDGAVASAGLSSVFAGASRLCRLRSRLPLGRARIAAGVLAPVATGFLLEALRLADLAGREVDGAVEIRFDGPAVDVWAAMATQLASAVGAARLAFRVVQGKGEPSALVVRSGRPVIELSLRATDQPGPSDGGTSGCPRRGYLVDEPRSLGLRSGTAETPIDLVLHLLTEAPAAGTVRELLEEFAAEVATVLPLLLRPSQPVGVGEVRPALDATLRTLWCEPGRHEAGELAGQLGPAGDRAWVAAHAAVATRPARVVAAASARIDALAHGLSRAAWFARHRHEARR